MLMPLLTAADPRDAAEGSLDPLGMYAIADALAVRLVTGVRERQMHPRFLTSIAVSLSLCSVFDEDVIADDGVSEPWQVFEWYLVEGLVRSTKDRSKLRGLPGLEKATKATKATKDGLPLSERRYLKTPTVFGFHGVYRALARDLGIEHAGRIGATGLEILQAWEDEQGLQGFVGTHAGPGRQIRRNLHDAIQDALKSGATKRSGTWAGWQFFRDHLGIYDVGVKEAAAIQQALLHTHQGYRGEVLRCLTSEQGRVLFAARIGQNDIERRFHELLSKQSSGELFELLAAIGAYEQFCRLLQDAFDQCLSQLAKYQTRIAPESLASGPLVQRAAHQIPDLFSMVSERLSVFGEAGRFEESFHSFAERLIPQLWVKRLLEHHCRIQRAKPPSGRAPWFDEFDDGMCMIRTAYLRDYKPRGDDSYVHAYRTQSLWSFAQDLKLV